MKKLFVFTIIVFELLTAKTLEIEATKITYTNKNQTIKLDKNVSIQDGTNLIKTQKAVIRLKKNKLLSYRAYGKVKFSYKTIDKLYNIQADNMSFDANTLEFKLMGNILIEDNTSNTIKANTITINQKNDKFAIEGDNQPVRLQFNINQ